MPTRAFSGGVAIVLVFSACTGGERVPGFATRDSAGVRIAEIPADVDLPLWSIDSVPEFVVGDRPDDPAHELFRVRSAALLPDGNLAIASQGSADIRIFDSTGQHLRTFGRQGGCPGEFEFLAGMLTSGDTLYAFDLRQQRITTFMASGDLLGTTPLPFTRAGSIGRLSDGSFVSTTFVGGLPRRPVGVQRDSTPIEIIRASGARDTVVDVTAFEWYSLGDNGVPIGLPLGGRTFVAASGDRITVVVADQRDVRQFGSDTRLEQIIRTGRERKALTDEDWEWAKTIYLADYQNDRRPEAEERWERVPRPDFSPVFRGVLASADGDIWLRAFTTDPAGGIWLVVGSDGTPLARVRHPAGKGILSVSGTRVVTLQFTDEGPRVSVHKLLR